MNLDTKALVETGKSFLRFMYFGLIGLVSTFLVSLLSDQSLMNAHITLNGVQLPVGFVIAAVVTGIVKLLDRYQHTNQNTESKGIAPEFLQS